MKILCYGDSNTYGYDGTDPFGGRLPEQVRWPELLGRSLGCECLNCGLNGRRVPHYPRSIETDLRLLSRALSGDLIIVMLGTNDCFRGISAMQIAERMDRFLDSIIGAAKQILLISPPVLRCDDWVQDDDMFEESQDLGEQYRELADRKGCLFADSEEWDIEMAFDGVHFSPEGHEVFAQKLEEILNEILKPE